MTPEDLVEIYQIERLKHRYLRLLDQKRFDELGQTLTPGATASYGGGAYLFEGRDAIVAFMKKTMSDEGQLTSHKAHQPEIDLLGPDRAKGVWALDDIVISTEFNMTISGAAFYDDTYEKHDGEWLIGSTGYKRIYEQIAPRTDISMTASWWGTGGRSEIAAG